METYDEFMKRYADEQKKIHDEVEHLIDIHTGSDGKTTLDKRFLRDFGCINFKSDEWMHELKLAREYHRILMESTIYGSEHKLVETEPYRCYHQTSCKCGFCEACDSSD